MYQIDFNKPINIHFIGIGGISMSGLAEILLDRGFGISGSDAKESDLTKHLIQKGAVVQYGQRASNITDDIRLVVYTAAIHPDNPELMEAEKKKYSLYDQSSPARRDHAELSDTDRHQRNARQNNNYLHVIRNPAGNGYRSYFIDRWYFERYRR